MQQRVTRRIKECAYCGHSKETSREHVIPRALFERPYPNNMITVPACDDCNVSKSKDDDFLRDILTTDAYASVSPEAQRIVSTKVAASRQRGSSELSKIMQEHAELVSFYGEGGIYLGDAPTAYIDRDRMNRASNLILRGLYYYEYGLRLPDHYVFETLRYHPGYFRSMREEFKGQLSKPKEWGNVFGYSHAKGKEDRFCTVWIMWFYRTLMFSMTCTEPGFYAELSKDRPPLLAFGERATGGGS